MWQVKPGSYFAFLKRCSELNIPLVQGVRAVLRFRLSHFIPGLCHTVVRKRMFDCLRILWGGALRKDLRHWAFPLLFSCTRHRRKIKSFPQLFSDFLFLPLLLPRPPAPHHSLTPVSHQTSPREITDAES